MGKAEDYWARVSCYRIDFRTASLTYLVARGPVLPLVGPARTPDDHRRRLDGHIVGVRHRGADERADRQNRRADATKASDVDTMIENVFLAI